MNATVIYAILIVIVAIVVDWVLAFAGVVNG